MYTVLTIKGEYTKDYKKRVYTITREEKENMFDTFVLRQTVDGQRVYKSCETDKYYIVA